MSLFNLRRGRFRHTRTFTSRTVVKGIYRALLDQLRPIRSSWSWSPSRTAAPMRGMADGKQSSIKLARMSTRERRRWLRRLAFNAARTLVTHRKRALYPPQSGSRRPEWSGAPKWERELGAFASSWSTQRGEA